MRRKGIGKMVNQNLKERRLKFNCNVYRFFIQFYVTVNDQFWSLLWFDQKGMELLLDAEYT